MKAVFSNYNFTPDWIRDYDFDYAIYDRSDLKEYLKDFPQERITYVGNAGSDLYDKFSWIIENYDYLPDVVLLSKSNLLKYITKEEFEKVKDNRTFTPLLTKNHRTYSDDKGVVCFYSGDGMYNERNDRWYLAAFHVKHDITKLMLLLGIADQPFVKFAPGSNYILPKEHILKHPKETYQYLRSMIDYDIYPGEAQILERGLYELWR